MSGVFIKTTNYDNCYCNHHIFDKRNPSIKIMCYVKKNFEAFAPIMSHSRRTTLSFITLHCTPQNGYFIKEHRGLLEPRYCRIE